MNYYVYIENNKIFITDNKILSKKEISTNNVKDNSDLEFYINNIYSNYKTVKSNFSNDNEDHLFNLNRNDDILKLINRDKYLDDIGDAQIKLENRELFDCKKKTLYDVSTEYFTKLFFKNEQINEIFQFIINTIFQIMIKKYIDENNLKETDILFIYKGGTTMKILFEKYKNLINIENYFDNKNFKRSDSDYSIIINPFIPNAEKHRKEIIKMSFVILNELRKVFSTCKNVLFDNCEFTDEKLKELIENFNLNLNNNLECKEIFKNIKIVGITYGDKLFFNEDKERFYENDEIKNIRIEEIDNQINKESPNAIIKKIGNILNRNYKSNRRDMYIENDQLFFMLDELNYKASKNNIYLSMNNNINQLQGKIENYNNNFTLLRLKMNTILFYINTLNNTIGISNAPSELIDLSIAKIDSDELKFVYEHDIRNEITKYKPIHTYLNFVYNGYSINGFIYDFIKQLYIESNPPWIGPKFEKKLQRFSFFILLSLLELKNKNQEITYKILYNNVEKLIVFFNYDYDTINKNIDIFKSLLDYIFKFFIEQKDISNIYLIKKYLLNLFDSNKNVYTQTKLIFTNINKYILDNPIQKTHYDSYRLEMGRNLKIIVVILRQLNMDTINIPVTSKVDIGVVNKYLKYKKKYLDLKNKFN